MVHEIIEHRRWDVRYVGCWPCPRRLDMHRPETEHASPTLFEPLTIYLIHFPARSSRGENKQKYMYA